MPCSTFAKGNESDAWPLLARTTTHGPTRHRRARRSASRRTPASGRRVFPADTEGPAAAAQLQTLAPARQSRAAAQASTNQALPPPARPEREVARERRPALGKLPHSRPATPRPAVRADRRERRPPPRRPKTPRGPGRAPRLRDAAGRPAGSRWSRLIWWSTARQGAAGPAAEASQPRVRSRRPRPDTQPQTCGLSRPGARLRAGNEAGRPGGAEGRGGGAAPLPARQREDSKDQAADTRQRRSLARHPRNGGLGGVRGPEEGARQGGRAAAGAPIGPGSRPSEQVSALSRGAPPRLVRRRPEGRSTFPLSAPAPPTLGCEHRAQRPLTRALLTARPRLHFSAARIPASSRPEREVAARGRRGLVRRKGRLGVVARDRENL